MAIVCGDNLIEGKSTEVSVWKLRANGTMGRTMGTSQSKDQGTWVAPQIKLLTLDFVSGNDLNVQEFQLHVSKDLIIVISSSDLES